jgi:hypothetical protein
MGNISRMSFDTLYRLVYGWCIHVGIRHDSPNDRSAGILSPLHTDRGYVGHVEESKSYFVIQADCRYHKSKTVLLSGIERK